MKNAINRLFSAEKGQPLLFVLMIYLVGATTDALADVLKAWLSPLQITIGGMIVVLLFILIVDPFSRMVKAVVHRDSFITRKLDEKHYKGMIVFASRGENPSAANAIREHIESLGKCWVITGDNNEMDGSKRNALDLANTFKNDLAKKIDGGKDFFEIIEMPGEYAYDPEKVYEVIDNIFSNLPEGIDEQDVIADYTGGTKSMTAGMILACALPSRNLQVLKPNVFKEDGTADRTHGEKRIGIDIHFKLKKKIK